MVTPDTQALLLLQTLICKHSVYGSAQMSAQETADAPRTSYLLCGQGDNINRERKSEESGPLTHTPRSDRFSDFVTPPAQRQACQQLTPAGGMIWGVTMLAQPMDLRWFGNEAEI